MNRPTIAFAAILLMAGGGVTIWGAWKFSKRGKARAEVISTEDDKEYRAASDDFITDFVLTERSGRKFDSKEEMPGHVWVTSVFFSSCPSSCRQQNEHVRDLHEEFGKQGVRFLSITCDPDNDTPDRLREYARLFRADPHEWLFLTGDDKLYLQRVATERFKIASLHNKRLGPTHSDQFTVVDKWGTVRGTFGWNAAGKLDELRTLVRELVKETTPGKPKSQPRPPIAGLDDEEVPPDPDVDAAAESDAERPPEPQ